MRVLSSCGRPAPDPTPFPFSLVSHRQTTPHHPPELDPKPLPFGDTTLSFLSLVFLFPWSFSRCEIPWSFWVFSAYFPGFLRVRQVREILGLLEVFLGVFEKTKERKDRDTNSRVHERGHARLSAF